MHVVSQAKVISIKSYSDDLREYLILPEKYKRYDAGTFLQLTLENVSASDYWPESRTFSMASAYDKKNGLIKLIIRKSGVYTTRIFDELQEGEECTIKYAFGDMLLPQFDSINNIVCIAAGSGIAPFLSFVDELKLENQLDRLELFYTVRRKEDLISYDYLINTINQKNIHLFSTDEDSDVASNRLMNINDIVQGKNYKDKHYYICGSPEFITFFKDELLKKGIKNIYLDEWE